MICRIQYRQGFGRVIGYAMKQEKHPELLASTLSARDTEGIIQEMEALRAGNSRCKQPVAHFVLSVKEGERLTDTQWTEAAQRTAGRFEMQQYIMVRHGDTDCDHAHLIGNRIKADGKAWSTSNDRKKMRDLCQELEQDFGITATASRSNRSRINKTEIEKADRLHRQGKQGAAVPARMQLATDIKMALAHSHSVQDFEERLKRKKISVRWRHDDQGRPIGVSFGRGEASISGRNAGVSCRALTVHFEKGIHEQSRRFTAPGGDTRLDRTIGRDAGLEAEGGFAAAGGGHRTVGQGDSQVGGGASDRSGDAASEAQAVAVLTDTAQAGGQLMVAALDRIIRELERHDGTDGYDGSKRQPVSRAHIKRILRPTRKPPNRPSR